MRKIARSNKTNKMNKTFIATYTVYSYNDSIIKSGKIKCKNRMSELDAKIKLEVFLKKKYPAFGRLVVHSCSEDVMGFMSAFNDIFKS